MAVVPGRFTGAGSSYVMADMMPTFSMTVPKLGSLMSRPPRGKPAKDPSEISSLTGIRAVAVMIVFMGHSGLPYSMAPLGVTIFFCLSGYLITTLLRREFDRNGKISLRAFYLRRACRILPPLYTVLILADLLTLDGAMQYHQLRLGACLSQFFFFSNYHILQTGWQGVQTGTAPGTGALWSLAVEEHFYLGDVASLGAVGDVELPEDCPQVEHVRGLVGLASPPSTAQRPLLPVLS